MDREGAGGAGRGPVHDGEDFRRARILSHYEIFCGGEGSDHAEFDGGGFHAEASVGTGEERIEFLHSVRAGGVEGLAGEKRRQTDSPLAMPFGIAGRRAAAAAFRSYKIVAGELVDGAMTGGYDGCRDGGDEGADAGLDLARSYRLG